jgi:hypothetical protein
MPHLAGVVPDERLERIVEYLKRTPVSVPRDSKRTQ